MLWGQVNTVDLFILADQKHLGPVSSTEANKQGKIHIHTVKYSEPPKQIDRAEIASWKFSFPMLTPQLYLVIVWESKAMPLLLQFSSMDA